MIYSLRRKLIWICGCSTAAVLVLIFLLTWFLSMRQLNLAMDMITDQLSENGGAFPALDDGPPKPTAPGGLPGSLPPGDPPPARRRPSPAG